MIDHLDRDDPRIDQVFALIKICFAGMEGRIDPPSSVHRLRVETLQDAARDGWVLAIGDPVCATVVLTPKPHALYLGKLAVSEKRQGQGLARKLVKQAEQIALTNGFDRLELQVRIELVENHAIFSKMGFGVTARGSHPSFNHITEMTMQKRLGGPIS